MSTPQSGKSTIYIDIDDEITTIIDKVRGAEERIVALVLPKRATMLQSIVNMKLLKRTADEAKKHLVLITSETGLLPLAGSVGLYVAKNLQSKPEIPITAAHHDGGEDVEEAVNMADDTSSLDKSRSVGEHASRAPASVVRPNGANTSVDEDAPIELDSDTPMPISPSTAASKAGKKSKKFSIPNFNKFRMWAVLGGVALVLIVFLWYIAFMVMPTADISVKTDSTALEESLDVTLSTTAKQTDIEDATVPAEITQTQKVATQQVDATGQKDKGQKASGAVVVKNCSDSPVTIPAGTAITASGLTFITQVALGLGSGNFSGTGVCKTSGNHIGAVNIVAQQSGDKYNLGPRSDYLVAGYSGVTASDSGGMKGGTSEIVKIVSQSDIDSASQKISSQDSTPVKQELLQALTAKSLYVIDATFKAGDPVVTATAKAGDETDKVTVTQKTTYSMMGTRQTELKKLISDAVKERIDKNKQQIIDYGLSGAVFKAQNLQTNSALVSMSVTAVAGSDLNTDEIKKQIAGKKSADAKELIGKYPGVTEVTVHYSPFWVSSIPKKASKITVTVEKPAVKNAR